MLLWLSRCSSCCGSSPSTTGTRSATSFVRRSGRLGAQFNRRAGLRAIGSRRARRASRRGASTGVPDDDARARRDVDDETDESCRQHRAWMVAPGDTEGARLVRLLRTAGSEGGIPLAEESELDARHLAVPVLRPTGRGAPAKMRQLLSAGVDPHELRTLEDLRDDLAKANDDGLDARPERNGNEAGAPKITGRGRQAGQARRRGLNALDHDPVRLDRHLDRRWPAQCSV